MVKRPPVSISSAHVYYGISFLTLRSPSLIAKMYNYLSDSSATSERYHDFRSNSYARFLLKTCVRINLEPLAYIDTTSRYSQLLLNV